MRHVSGVVALFGVRRRRTTGVALGRRVRPRYLLPLVVLTLSACGQGPGRESERVPPASTRGQAILDEPDTSLTAVYAAVDFTLTHPRDAHVEFDENRNEVWPLPGDRIVGPRTDPEREGGAYYVAIGRVVVHGAASAAAWADSVRRLRNDSEFDADSLFFVGPATDTLLNGYPAKVLDPPCGDCRVRHFILARDSTLAVLTYISNGLESWDRARAERVGERIIGSFRWTSPASTP